MTVVITTEEAAAQAAASLYPGPADHPVTACGCHPCSFMRLLQGVFQTGWLAGAKHETTIGIEWSHDIAAILDVREGETVRVAATRVVKDRNDMAEEATHNLRIIRECERVLDAGQVPAGEHVEADTRGGLLSRIAWLLQRRDAFDMYRRAWIRELGGKLVPKHHEIDGLVLTTKRLVKEHAESVVAQAAAEQAHAEAATLARQQDQTIKAQAASRAVALRELADLRREVEAVLDTIPDAVRVCEGGGPENLAASLAVSVAKLRQEKAKLVLGQVVAEAQADGTYDARPDWQFEKAHGTLMALANHYDGKCLRCAHRHPKHAGWCNIGTTLAELGETIEVAA